MLTFLFSDLERHALPSVAIIGTRGYPSYYGGFETAIRKLAPYLVDHGWDVTVYSRPGGTRVDDPTRDERVKSVETWGIDKNSLSTLTYGLAATRHAMRHRPDVALVMNVANGYWLPMLRRTGIPTVINVDGIEWQRDKWGHFARSVFYRGAKLTARHGTTMVYDSKEIARRWKAEFGLDGDFIPYGGETTEDELPLEPGLRHRQYVLMVARFVPENSVPEFFEAAPAIADKIDVVIVGSAGYGGQLNERARLLASNHERIHWLGHVSDDRRLFSLWQHAGVYFHGHSVGGTNPALVQAMALGAPVVARDTAYNREVVGESGHFSARAAASISEKIFALAADPDGQERESLRLSQRARELYTWDLVCAGYERALRKNLAPGVQ